MALFTLSGDTGQRAGDGTKKSSWRHEVAQKKDRPFITFVSCDDQSNITTTPKDFAVGNISVRFKTMRTARNMMSRGESEYVLHGT